MAANGARRSPRAPKSNHTPQAAKSGKRSKKPRFDQYEKLIHRFYEPLVLLDILGQTRAPHDEDPGEPSTPQDRRRRLLTNLSYLCDCDKGGDTTAAIGLEETAETYKFWLASNLTSSDDKVMTFLRETLAGVKKIIRSHGDRREDAVNRFVKACVEFARRRVIKEQGLLIQKVRSCEGYLNTAEDIEDKMLWEWLQCLCDRGLDPEALCLKTYGQRKASYMKYLEAKIKSARERGYDEIYSAFQQTRHYIGRLSHHVRAPKKIIEDASKLPGIFDVYDVARVPQMRNIDPPKADGHTTPQGILNRMGAFSDDKSRLEYEEILSSMNQKYQLDKRILEKYDMPTFKPKVHAEIQVLEYFYQRNLRFADDDRYIGCSKPACFCCRLYFRHHPMSCVELDAHHNIWLNWGPPGLPNGSNDEWYKHQRGILQGMLETIRKEVLDQLKKKAGPLKRQHADSRTGITQSILSEPLNHHPLSATQSMVSEPLNHHPLPTIEESFDALSIDQTYSSTSDTEANRPSSPSYSSLSSARAAGSSSSQQSEAPSDDESDSDSDSDGGADIE